MNNRIIISIKELNKSNWGLIYQFIKRFYDNSPIDNQTFDELRSKNITLKYSDKALDTDVYSEYGNDLQLTTALNKENTTFSIIYNKQDTNRDFNNLVPFYFLHKKFTNKVTFGINLEKFDFNNQSYFTFPCRTFFEIYRDSKPINGQNTVYFINEKNLDRETGELKIYKSTIGYFRDSDNRNVSRFMLPITEINQENFYLLFKGRNKENEKIKYFIKSIEKQDEKLNTDILDKYCEYIFEEWFIKAYFISQNYKVIDENSLLDTVSLLKSYCDNIKELIENIIFHTVDKDGIFYVIFNEGKNLQEKQREKLHDFCNYQSSDRFAEIGIMDFNEKGIVDTYQKSIEEEMESINLSYFFDTENIVSTGLTHLDLRNIAHLGIKIFAKSVQNYNGYFYIESNTDNNKTYVEYSKTQFTKEEQLKYFFDGTHYEIVFPVATQEKPNYISNTTIDGYKKNKWKINSIDFAPIYNSHKIETNDYKLIYNDKIKIIVEKLLEKTNEQTVTIAINMNNVDIEHVTLFKILLYFQSNCKNKETGFEVILLTHLQEKLIDKCCETVNKLLLVNNKETIWNNRHAIVLLSDTLKKCQLLCGKTKDEFLYINDAISKIYLANNYFAENFNRDNISKDDLDILNEFVQYYECISDSGRIFENNVSNILDNPIEIDGYGCKVSNEITRLSSRMAIKKYYEADFLFKDSFYANRFAQMIFNNLKEDPSYEEKIKNKGIVIIGYCYYSELLIKKLQSFLGKHINIVIANEVSDKNNKEELDFIHIDELTKKPEDYFYIVIVPISSTLTTIDKTIALLKNKIGGNNLTKTDFANYCAILIRDGNDKITPKEINQGWEEKSEISKIITTNFANAGKVNFIIEKQGTWIENFDPELFPKNWLEEKPINNTKNASLNSQNLMGYPSAYINKEDINVMEKRFEEVKKFIYCGHLINGNERYHQRYCFYTEDFVKQDIVKQKQQKETLFLTWLQDLREKKFKNLEQKTNIIITPYSDVEADFVNIVNKELFDNKAQILYIEIDKPRGNINFKYSFLKKIFETNPKNVAFHFVDNVLSTGESFKRAKSFLLSILNYPQNNLHFESIITFVNRLSKNRIQEIKIDDGQGNREIIFSFINLFIPPAREFHKKCSLCELADLYKDMKKNTVLNSCIKTIDEKLRKIEPISFDDIKNGKIKSGHIEDRSFAKMKLTHMIYSEISKIVENNQIANSSDNSKLDKEIYNKLNNIYDDCVAKDNNQTDYSNRIEKLSFLKAISAPPLNQYIKIRYYAHTKLLDALNDLFDIESPSYHNMQELKVILKQLSCLGANALVRRDVIVKSWELYYKFKKREEDIIKDYISDREKIKTSVYECINTLFYQDIENNLDNSKLLDEIKEKEYSKYKFPKQLLSCFNSNPTTHKFVTESCNFYIDFISQYRNAMEENREKDEDTKISIAKEYGEKYNNLIEKITIQKKEILGKNYEKTKKTITSINRIKIIFNTNVAKKEFEENLNKILSSENLRGEMITPLFDMDTPMFEFIEKINKHKNDIKEIVKDINKHKSDINKHRDFCSDFQFFIKTAIYKDEAKSMWLGELLRTGKEPNCPDVNISETIINNSLFKELNDRVYKYDKEYQNFLVWLFYDNTTITRKTLENFEKEQIDDDIRNKVKQQYYYWAFKKYINQKTDSNPIGNPDKIDFFAKLIYVLDAKKRLTKMLENIKQNTNELDFKQFITTLLDIFKNIMNAEDAFFSMKHSTEKIHTVAQSQNFTKEINYDNSFVKHIFGIKDIINPLQISDFKDVSEITYYEKTDLNYSKMICLSLFKQDHTGNESKKRNILLKINGIFSFLYNDLQNFDVLSKEYGRLLLLLKPELDEYIEHIHSEKMYDLWVIKNEKVRFYEEKFDKFNHTAKRHIDKTQIVREYGSQKALFAINELVFGQVLLGNKYAEYLKSKKIEGEKPSGSTQFTDVEKRYLMDFTVGLNEIYQMKYFEKFDINIWGYENIATKIRFDELKIILIELICNTVDIKSGKDKKININFGNNYIIFSSITGISKTEAEIMEINRDIKDDYPKDGIGLFMINKIVYSVLQKNIKVKYDNLNKEFQVIIPIN